MKSNLCSSLGLAMRAGKLATGEEAVMSAVRTRQARLVLVARDASYGTMKRYRDKCRFYEIPLAACLSREELGACIGKAQRVAVAVTDNGFARIIRNNLGNLPEVEYIE